MNKEELKKEAFEYAYNKTQKLHSSSERDFVYRIYLEITEPREERIAKLEEENRELREKCEKLEQGYVWHDYDAGEDCYEDSHEGRWVKRDEICKFDKAKEIIKDQKELLDSVLSGAETLSDFAQNTLRNAEQFLRNND